MHWQRKANLFATQIHLYFQNIKTSMGEKSLTYYRTTIKLRYILTGVERREWASHNNVKVIIYTTC